MSDNRNIQSDEVDRENNVAEKMVYVHEGKQIKVLYVEGYRRYEYSYVKTLLEREANFKGNKSIKLRVYLQDADPELYKSDPTIIKAMPQPIRDADGHTTDEDLWSYDLVVLGDVDPEDRMAENFKNLAEFVRERLIDCVAAELGLDPADVRRRNFIDASEMPYEVGGVPLGQRTVYDCGD